MYVEGEAARWRGAETVIGKESGEVGETDRDAKRTKAATRAMSGGEVGA